MKSHHLPLSTELLTKQGRYNQDTENISSSWTKITYTIVSLKTDL